MDSMDSRDIKGSMDNMGSMDDMDDKDSVDDIERMNQQVTDACMENLAKVIGNYKGVELGRQLKVEESELQRLANDSPSQQILYYQLMRLWSEKERKKEGGQPTYSKLYDALVSVKEMYVAKKLLHSRDFEHVPAAASDNRRIVLPCYKMEKKKRGKCLILTYDKFDKKEETENQLDLRPGNEVDERNLRETFQTLGFDVVCQRNSNSSKTKQLIQEMASKQGFNSFVLFVCSHGDKDGFYASDNKIITIQEIITLFKAENCQGFAGKPKMFFFNHCAGNKRGTMVKIQPDNVSGQIGVAANNYRPNEADFCIVSSTVPGFVSYRHEERGTLFAQHLCDSLRANHETQPLFDILLISSDTMLNEFEEICRESNGSSSKCQVPHLVSTLTKAVYFVDQQM